MSKTDEPVGTKDSTDDKFVYQEEFVRQAPPTMEDVKKLPRYNQERPVVRHREQGDSVEG